MEFKSTVGKIAASYTTTIVLLLIYALVLAIATLIEKYVGTEAAKTIIYYSPAIILLQASFVVNFIAVSLKHRLFKKRKWGFIVIHLAFIVILTGALITHIFGEEGTIHLREGESTSQMFIQTNNGDRHVSLPFSIKLKEFTLTRYPGSSSPSSFESTILIHENGTFTEKKVSMNNTLDINGYRLFQSSYDADEKGTILSVNKDIPGRQITYTGYFMLIIGFILFFIDKNSRFRKLGYRLKELRNSSKSLVAIMIMIISSLSLNAQNTNSDIAQAIQKNNISPDHAALFGALSIQSSDGRIKPINTFSSEVLRKLHKSDKIWDFNSDQFLLSLLTFPEMWRHVPLIHLPNKDIAAHFDLANTKKCAYIELFDSDGNYKLQQELEKIYRKEPSARNKFEKNILKLDEQINIFHQLINFEMLNIFPDQGEPNHKWYAPGDDFTISDRRDSLFVSSIIPLYLGSIRTGLETEDWEKADEILNRINIYQQEKDAALHIDIKKIKTELLYNHLDIFRLCRKIYLILGGMLLLLVIVALFKEQKYIKWSISILSMLIICGFAYHAFGIGLRWYIAGYAPWSNSYETMIYVSLITVLAGILFSKQSKITFALATLFGGVVLFVSGLNWMDPQISPLVPVLKSPWLMFHVAIIVAAYGFFGISFLLGITNLTILSINKKKNSALIASRIQELTIINEMSLWIGLCLLTIGTFLGAVWANESWGRYWGWDPKETWALITIVIYAVSTHLSLVKKWDNPKYLNICSILAFFCVLMTYFGVNYFLSGMHSYG